MHHSSSVAAWVNLGVVINGSNLPPYVFPNGTVVVAFKNIPNGLRIVTAPTWRGPYTTRTRNNSEIILDGKPKGLSIEDFNLWFDAKRRRWHCLLHQYERKHLAPGGFAYTRSENLLEWEFGPPAYNYTLAMTDGRTFTPTHRERPKLLFDTNGEPQYLFNGVATAAYGKTYTVVQPIVAFMPPSPRKQ